MLSEMSKLAWEDVGQEAGRTQVSSDRQETADQDSHERTGRDRHCAGSQTQSSWF
jgi:hypothetical protein